MSKPNWISEQAAAERLGYQPRTLRKYVKGGVLDISYTTVRGRRYQYDEKAIEKVLNKNAVLINS